MKEYDDKGYGQGFRVTPTVAIRMERRCDLILNQINVMPSTRIIELGCGTGFMAYLLAKKSGAQVIGTDICKSFMDQANASFQLSNLRFEYLNCTLEESFQHFGKEASIDAFVGNGILHHLVRELKSVFKKLRYYLKPGGKLVFLEPNIYNPYCFLIHNVPWLRQWKRLEPGECAFSKKFAELSLIAAGFVDVSVQYRDFLLPFIPEPLVKPCIKIGARLEKMPLLRMLSQSIFLLAQKPF